MNKTIKDKIKLHTIENALLFKKIIRLFVIKDNFRFKIVAPLTDAVFIDEKVIEHWA